MIWQSSVNAPIENHEENVNESQNGDEVWWEKIIAPIEFLEVVNGKPQRRI